MPNLWGLKKSCNLFEQKDKGTKGQHRNKGTTQEQRNKEITHEQGNKGTTRQQRNKGTKEQRDNTGTKEQRNKGTKRTKEKRNIGILTKKSSKWVLHNQVSWSSFFSDQHHHNHHQTISLHSAPLRIQGMAQIDKNPLQQQNPKNGPPTPPKISKINMKRKKYYYILKIL